MPPDVIPEPWYSFLRELDADLSDDLHVHCMGGFVVTLLYDFSRTTSDIDVLAVISRERSGELFKLGGKGSALHKKCGVYLDSVGVATPPENYEERLQMMFPGALPHLHLLALDPYDLALTKIGRNIQRDRDDVKHLARKVPFDLQTLKWRYEKELRPYLASPEREDTTLRLWIEMIEEERRG
jgi:hypothetical protein